jgi:biotin carboxyl carrier protein
MLTNQKKGHLMDNDSFWITYAIGFISGIVITIIIGNIIPRIRSRILAAQKEKIKRRNIENDIALCSSKAVVRADYSGAVYKLCVPEAALVKEGDVVLVFETMKLEIEVKAPVTGFITFYREVGEVCDANDPLFAII